MAKLIFSVNDVKPLVAETLAATEWRDCSYGARPVKPALWLVKDTGIYLMSNAKREGLPNVVYAKDYGPDADYDKIVKALGGDDSVSAIPIGLFAGLEDFSGGIIEVKKSPATFSMLFKKGVGK